MWRYATDCNSPLRFDRCTPGKATCRGLVGHVRLVKGSHVALQRSALENPSALITLLGECVPVAMLTARAGLVGLGGEGRGLFFLPLDCQGSLKAPLPFWEGLGGFTGSPCMPTPSQRHSTALIAMCLCSRKLGC